MTSRRALAGVCLVFAVVWAGWLGQRHLAGKASILDRIEAVFVDLRLLLSGPLDPPRDVVIVAIDDATVSAEGGYPLDRTRLARLVDTIAQAGSAGLAIDLLLLDETDPVADLALEHALAGLPTVIAAAARFDGAGQAGSVLPASLDEFRPLQRFQRSSQVGLVNIVTDAGGTPRHLPLVFLTGRGAEPGFALRAAGLMGHQPPSLTQKGVRIAGVLRPLDLGWHLPLRPYGPRGTIRTLSAAELFASPHGGFDLQRKLVLLGATATGVGDRFNTVFDPVLPGIEVLATGLANLSEGTGLIRDAGIRRIDAGSALLLAMLMVVALFALPLAMGSAVSLALIAGWLGINAYLFGQGYWLSASLPLAAGLPPLMITVLIRQILDRRFARKQAVARAELSRFQAPSLARMIAEDPTFLWSPVEQSAAILFLDLSGFTGVSERLGPTETRSFLKAFHTRVAESVAEQGGLVLDFMGDGAMIGFGIPDPGDTDGEHALTAAVSLVHRINAWVAGSDMATGIRGVRIGVHFGPVVLSRLGHETHQQIAATGDSVNLASRLMDICKDYGASIAATKALLAACDDIEGKFPPPATVETVEIRGRQQGVTVWLWRSEDLQRAP